MTLSPALSVSQATSTTWVPPAFRPVLLSASSPTQSLGSVSHALIPTAPTALPPTRTHAMRVTSVAGTIWMGAPAPTVQLLTS